MPDNTNVVSASKPVKRRRSFGGANGVWWRRKRRTPAENTNIDSSQKVREEESAPNDTPKIHAEIEWDEDLCRPIYRKAVVVVDSGSIEEEEADHDEDDGSPNASPTPSSPTSQSFDTSNNNNNEDEHSTVKRLWMKAPVKRKKSFATRKRPYSFSLLEEETASSSSSTSSSPSSSQGDTHSQISSSNQTVTSSSTTLSFTEANKVQKKEEKKRQKRILPKDEAALLKAKQFFATLDATQPLTIDTLQESPQSSSKITRTTHKLNLQSPRLTREYQQYAQASLESGVSPFSIRTYATSRREFFRKQELFDGFLDD